ncbi:hypothetical protein [Rhodopila sp.]|uniref:hypothetical protein n=1 Tax=Rhodopila sp. TaxID=2480087 RepID=UPI003D0B6D6E
MIDLSGLPLDAFTQPLTAGNVVLTLRNEDSAAPTIAVVNKVHVITATGNFSHGGDVFLTVADGGTFSLISVDIGLLPGYGSSGQSVATAISIDNLNGVATSSPQRTNLGTQFANITSVDLDATGGVFYENINVNAVPKPAT